MAIELKCARVGCMQICSLSLIGSTNVCLCVCVCVDACVQYEVCLKLFYPKEIHEFLDRENRSLFMVCL